MLPKLKPLCDSLIEVRNECDGYAHSMDVLRVSAAHLVRIDRKFNK